MPSGEARRQTKRKSFAPRSFRRSTAATAEFYLARQENAYRGYLLSRDGYYLDRVNQHRAKFLEAMEKLRADLPAERDAPVEKALQANAEWYKHVVEAGQALIAEGKVAEAAKIRAE